MNLKFLRKFSWVLLLSTIISASLFAQQRQITGKVVDQKDGQPVPGVTVGIRGKTNNVSTNDKGEFALVADPATDALVFSYVGYVRQVVPLAGKNNLTVNFVEESQSLDNDAVVVVGYGTKKRSEILGSVATITGSEIQDIPAPNLAGAMRNRIAGVGVSQTSGRPGSPITLNIRNATVSATAEQNGVTAEPLYIIDGITVTRDAFDNVDASMVESIAFLKDASAAIYGAAGAKGVVLVTTKRGAVGKPTLTYNGYLGVSDAAKEPEMLSAYNQALLLNDGYLQTGANATSFFSLADLEILKNTNYKSWYDEIWQSSTTQRHNLSLSGGNDKVTFFAGGSYQNEDGNFVGLNFDKYSFRSGVVATLANGLKADVNFNVDWSVRNAQHNLTDNDAPFFEQIVAVPRWVPNSIDGKFVNYSGVTLNPNAVINSGYYNKRKSKGYRINASLTYQPTFVKGLTARFQVSQGSNATNSRTYSPPYQVFNFARIGNNSALFTDQLLSATDAVSSANQRTTPGLAESNSYQGFATLQYGRTFGKHTFDIMAGGEQSESNSESLSIYRSNQLIPGGEDLFAFDINTLTLQNNDRTEAVKRSVFGRASYNFDKKYLLDFVIRSDASSNFAPGKRWGLSPSLGLGWIISQENFFKNTSFLDFVNYLKFKVNYGITGDDRVSSRLWQARYTIDTNNGYVYGDANANGLNPSFFPNPDLTWEKKRTLNVGIEATMFDNKLTVNVEAFQNRNYDGIDRGGNNLYPLYGGFTAPIVNYRETYNWGSEFSVGYRTNLTRDLKMNASVNFAYGNSINTRLIYAPGDLLNVVPNDWVTSFGTDPRRYNSNNIGLKTIGMFRTQADVDAFMKVNPNYRIYTRVPEPGFLYYEDNNGDGVITDSDMVPLFDSTNSWFSGGFNLDFSYKAFSLQTNIAARFGGKVFYDSRARTAPTLTKNVLTIWEDRWTQANPTQGKFPRADDPSITRNSDFWAVDGTTIRINSMTLSYKAPAKFANKLGLTGARLLVTGNNLWTLVNPLPYKDPYTASAWDYPILRTISVGLNVNL